MKLGDAFLMSVPPNFDREHLFFVISDPSKNEGTFLIANITGDEFRAGKECVLVKGDHPWITKESFVTFTDAMEITPEHAQKIDALMGTTIKAQPPLKAEVLAKIIEAAKKSKAIAIDFKKYL
jgi:hypothetical protein